MKLKRISNIRERDIPLSASGRCGRRRRAPFPAAPNSNSFFARFATLVLAEPVSLTHFFILVRLITTSNIFLNISAKKTHARIVLFSYFCVIRIVIRLWYCDKDALLCFGFLFLVGRHVYISCDTDAIICVISACVNL